MHADAESRTHHVAIRHAADYELVAEFTDVPEASRRRFDEPAPLVDADEHALEIAEERFDAPGGPRPWRVRDASGARSAGA